MLPEYFWIASSSVQPTYARGGCTKHAEGTCRHVSKLLLAANVPFRAKLLACAEHLSRVF